MKRTSPEEFEKRVAIFSPNVKLLEEYKDMKTKIHCRCRECKYEWDATPAVLLRGEEGRTKKGGGCPQCAGVRAKTHEEFIAELKALRPTVQVLSKYKGANRDIKCRCERCGHVWWDTPHNLLHDRDSLCPAESKNQKKTTEAFIAEMKKINPDIEIISEYVNAKTEIGCRCMKCGNEWASTPDSLRRGTKCANCTSEKLRNERMMDEEEFIRRVGEVSPNIEITGRYTGTAQRVECVCRKCKRKWYPYASNLLSGYNCIACFGKPAKTHKAFLREAQKKNPHVEVLGTYKNSKERVLVRCKRCGREWQMHPDSILRGSKCRCCEPYKNSSQEEFIAMAFERAFGKAKVKRHDKSLIGKELDIFIPSEKIAIEPGSFKLHKGHIKQDQEKRMKCMEKDVRLLTVYYDVEADFGFNETESGLLVVKNNMTSLSNKKRAVEKIFQMMGLRCAFSDAIWEKINQDSRKRVQRKTAEEYRQELEEQHPDFQLLSDYVDSNTPVKVRCINCGHEWENDPYRLKKRKACPMKCTEDAVVFLKDDFIAMAKETAPNTIIDADALNEYVKRTTRIKCKCRKCGHENQRRRDSILRGDACPKCDLHNTKKTHEAFIEEISGNTNIEVLGTYQGMRKPILCRCKICNHQWSPIPDSLLHGHGCPKCAGNTRKRHEVFVEEIKDINPNIEIVGKYTKRKSKIRCRCRKCGHQWEPWIDSLYRSCRCPDCGA